MTTAMMRIVLRLVAIAIVIAALIDPVFSSTSDAGGELVAIAAMDVATDASAALARLRNAAKGWDIAIRPTAGPVLPCAPGERCVIVADGSIDLDVPADITGSLSLITEKAIGEPNVEVRRVMVSSTHASAAGSANVELVRSGTVPATEIRITDDGAVVGRATHSWGQETSASVEVPWWPIQTGARLLRVEAVPVLGEASNIDNRVDVGVEVAAVRWRVLVFDARPSWSSTFVRRALEDDPRFTVAHRARVAPSLSAGTAGTRLDAAILDDVAVVIVGGPDALAENDVALIDAFVRTRGGTALLLPEQRASGPADRLFPGTWTEHLTAAPERIGPLYAGEVLRVTDVPLANIIARSATEPSIVSVPWGNGRIIISGAMDAWRHRDKDAGAFDRFWRSLVAKGASAGAPLSVTFDHSLNTPGIKVPFVVRDQRMTRTTSAEASAIQRCSDGAATVVRLRPGGLAGSFIGEASSAAAGPCTIEVAVDGRQTVASFVAAGRPLRGTSATLTHLVDAVGATHGVVINSGDEATLIAGLERDRQPSSQVVSTRPMRSPWWMIPFAACLAAEWWLRRRDGLR